MILVIIGIIVVVVTLVGTVAVNRADGVGSAIFVGSIAALVAAFFSIVVILIATLSLGRVFGYDTVMSRRDIVALTDERSSTGGTFFLGFGTVGTSAMYTFYVQNGNGARELIQESPYKIQVFEDANQPYALWATSCIPHHPLIIGCDLHHSGLREIHVPPGSIKTGIQLGVAPK